MPGVAFTLASKVEDLPRLERALLEIASTDPERITLTSTYYDTTAGRLKRDGLSLQVRKRDGQYTRMVMAEVLEESPFAGQECEDVIDGYRQHLIALNVSSDVPEVLSDPELRARFTTVVQRTRFLLEPDATTQIAGLVDTGEIQAAEDNRSEPICEVGLHLRHGDPAALYGTGLRLLEIAPLRIEARSKVERGYQLLENTAAKPRAQYNLSFGLEASTTVEESLQKIGLGCLSLLLRNEAAALGDVPEGVHQMRVAVRRLRSVLATMKQMLPSEQYEWVSNELKWMAGELGPVRNWDVFQRDLLAPVRSALVNDRDLCELCCICEDQRRSAHERAIAAIRSLRYTAALLRLSHWFISCRWRNQTVSEQSALLLAPISKVAPSLIGRRFKKVKKSICGFAALTSERRHEFRIAVKKLRYAIEVLKDVFDRRDVAEFVALLKPLQDDLGYVNDVRVANQLLADLKISDPAIARAVGAVLGWHNRGVADRDGKLRKHVRKFSDAQPFW
jgi:triphosphatase